MRIVSIPVGFTPHHLLALRGISTFMADQLTGSLSQSIDRGCYEEAVETAKQIFPAARSAHDPNAQALVYLYQAEALYRLGCLEEALEHTQQALVWLRSEVTQVATYNQAVAFYFEGLLHFVLRADAQALYAFNAAQEALVPSERFWDFEKNAIRSTACRTLSRWMPRLANLRANTPPGEMVMVVPVYEMVNRTLTLVDALSVKPFLVQLPHDALATYLPRNYVPLEIEAVLFLQLWPDVHYLALKILRKSELVRESRVGDMLLIEATSSVPPKEVVTLTRDLPFVRRTDGQIIFGPYEQQDEVFSGIPRLLIKKENKP
jgi:tetratricopeptide (TPR) repeat protein